jgi:hypothetical protein
LTRVTRNAGWLRFWDRIDGSAGPRQNIDEAALKSLANSIMNTYLHPDRTDVLHGQSIRFSSPAVLNDPFELKPHLAALASPEHMEAHITRVLPELVHWTSPALVDR